MKHLAIICSILLCLGMNIYGQITDTLTLNDLEIPNSPAFILLDQTPTAIERPNSSKAFILSILNSFQDNNGLPKNFAADFTPFWFFKHPNITSLNYAGYNVDKQRQRIFGNLKKASVSYAFTITTDTMINKPINNLSMGIRFNIITIRSKKDIEDLKKANSDLIDTIKNRDKRLNQYVDISLIVIDPTLYHLKVKEFYKLEEENAKDNKESIKDILSRRPKFGIDGAIGYNNFFVDNNYSDGHFGRFGAWMTLNYSNHLDKDGSGNNYLNLYAIGRYISDGMSMTDGNYNKQNFYDLGGKIEFEFKKISFAYEYIFRADDLSNSHRSNGLLKYKISDKLFLTGAFGKNFGNSNNLISLLGLNWGLSTGLEKTAIKE